MSTPEVSKVPTSITVNPWDHQALIAGYVGEADPSKPTPPKNNVKASIEEFVKLTANLNADQRLEISQKRFADRKVSHVPILDEVRKMVPDAQKEVIHSKNLKALQDAPNDWSDHTKKYLGITLAIIGIAITILGLIALSGFMLPLLIGTMGVGLAVFTALAITGIGMASTIFGSKYLKAGMRNEAFNQKLLEIREEEIKKLDQRKGLKLLQEFTISSHDSEAPKHDSYTITSEKIKLEELQKRITVHSDKAKKLYEASIEKLDAAVAAPTK